MKRKYIFILFVLTLAVGIAIRRAPWSFYTEIEVPVLRLDTAQLTHIAVQHSDGPAWHYQKDITRWWIEQDGRTTPLPATFADSLLRLLHYLPSLRLLPSGHSQDTLLQNNKNILKISFWYNNKLKTEAKCLFYNSREALMLLPPQPAVYVVPAQTFQLFAENMSRFRPSGGAFNFPIASLTALRVFCDDTLRLHWEKQDTAGRSTQQQQRLRATQDSIAQWCGQLLRLKQLDFADFFDEEPRVGQLRATVELETQNQMRPLRLRFIAGTGMNMPEDISSVRHLKKIPPFILHSSQDENNYYSIFDTTLLFQLLPYAR